MASRSTGLVELSQRQEKNAERDCNRLLVGRYKLALPVKLTELETECDMTVPVLRLRDWFEYLVGANHTHILVGLKEPDWKREADILKAFWDRYRVQCPDHHVFVEEREDSLDLSTCYPLVFHGDEGRGRKRAAFLVMNFHSLLGQRVQQKKQKKRGKKERYLKMECNFQGHSLTTRFLLAALPKHFYTGERESVFQSLIDLAASEAEYMFHGGVEDTRTGQGRVKAVLLHISGDWPFLTDSGGLLRSFRNVQKRKTRKSLPNGICHLCAAGTVGWDFEQINSKKPRWLQSMHDPSHPLFAEGAPTPWYHVHPAKNIGELWAFDLFTPFTWVWLAASSDLASFFCQSWRVQLRSTIVFRLCLLATFPGVRVSRNVVLSPRSRRSMSNGRRRHRIHQAAGTKAVSAQFSCSGCRVDTTVKVHLGTECLQLLVKLRYQRIGSFVSSTTGKHGCRLKRQQKRASCVLIS